MRVTIALQRWFFYVNNCLMRKKTPPQDFSTLKHIDPKNRSQCDYWTRRWGVSSSQLRAAFRNSRNTEVKTIERYLRERGAL